MYLARKIALVTYYSATVDDYFTRNNCGSGYVGSQAYVYFIAGSYTSTVSQADADNIALAAAQDYANTNGTCISNNGNLPSISELTFWSMGTTNADIETSVYEQGGGAIIERGICWSSANSIPTINDSKVTIPATPELQRTIVTGLTPATAYYWRAYAKNSNGIAYLPSTDGFFYPTL